ncbi:hypothetical protein WN72_39755 [Bradyrhizobium arachidis]|uniref:Uncharacterized protein n=1 Tax=Bradyrhizobium arachidis TaxID=858423 RepID=A0AAE7NX10_9BRAD|nr:hypothetical protein WN72_39755 [Bradyrhizobium arachidis]
MPISAAPRRRSAIYPLVMAGLDPAIHVLGCSTKNVGARDEPGHDDLPCKFAYAIIRPRPGLVSVTILCKYHTVRWGVRTD